MTRSYGKVELRNETSCAVRLPVAGFKKIDSRSGSFLELNSANGERLVETSTTKLLVRSTWGKTSSTPGKNPNRSEIGFRAQNTATFSNFLRKARSANPEA